ncbi:hypothetical protein ETSB_0717 [cyanobacterium endosymbiont of Epithemia turgida isolate EtSB Lake Yunoko]|nr:hypothetical protein ETSB_0717 [cyanobacterium endosymbiont of Epithemia turgida isolate EtSB Lake Yunoko]
MFILQKFYIQYAKGSRDKQPAITLLSKIRQWNNNYFKRKPHSRFDFRYNFSKERRMLMESEINPGLFHLLTTLITKVTDNLSSVEIAEAVEYIGASLGFN